MAWFIVVAGLVVSVLACSAVWALARPTRDYGQCALADAPKPTDPGYARWVEECKLEKLRALPRAPAVPVQLPSRGSGGVRLAMRQNGGQRRPGPPTTVRF